MFFTGYTLTQLGEGTFYSNDRTPPG